MSRSLYKGKYLPGRVFIRSMILTYEYTSALIRVQRWLANEGKYIYELFPTKRDIVFIEEKCYVSSYLTFLNPANPRLRSL